MNVEETVLERLPFPIKDCTGGPLACEIENCTGNARYIWREREKESDPGLAEALGTFVCDSCQ